MDPLTNSLSAFVLSRTGLGKLSPRGELAIILGASLPDLDFLSVLVSPVHLVTFVGGPLHALIAAPFLAVGLALALRLRSAKPISLLRLSALALAGILIRLALDLCNVDGVQLFFPFDRSWFHLDMLPWFDPWLLLLLLCFAFWPCISYLVNVELGIRETAGRGFAFVTILLACAYGGYRAANLAEAINTVSNHSYGGEVPLREACYPDEYSLARMHCVVETDNQFANIEYFIGEYFDATEAQLLKRQNRALWQVAQFQSAWYQQVSERLRMPYWTVFPADFPTGAKEAIMRDLILAPEPYPRFRLRILLDQRERMLEEAFVVESREFGSFERSRTP